MHKKSTIQAVVVTVLGATYLTAAVVTGVSKLFSCEDLGVRELRLEGPDIRP